MGIDLIYANANKEDIGIMRDYTLDLAFGSDENNFECKIVESNHCCEKDFFLYIESTEYGGIVDDIAVDTDDGEVTYLGRTWHGILNSKVLEPDSGADYLICSGEANSVLSTLIDRMGLNSLFKATADSSAITISNYKMNRYIGGYDGIVKMLKSVGAKLTMKFNDGFVELSAKPIVDYSKDEQFDTDLIALNIKKKGNVVNHIICLGKGDLKDREVIHIYADEKGNISQNQVFTGLAEVTAVYENTNAADSEELKQGGIDILKNAWASNEIDFDFIDDEESYDIGDIIGAEEHITGTEVAREITKKIVNISNNTVIVSYPTDSSGGGYTQTSSGGGGGTAGGSGGGNVSINLNGTEEVGEVVPINADYLGGVPASEYAKKSDVGMELLWTNASPTSGFVAQKVYVDLAKYDFIIIEAKQATTVDSFSYTLAKKGVQSKIMMIYDSRQIRTFTVHDTNVDFGAGNSGNYNEATTTNNNSAVPTRIYGIK